MRIDHTAISRAATAVAGLLVLVQLMSVVLNDQVAYVSTIIVALAGATAIMGVKLCRDNCLESRVMVAMLASLSGAGGILTATAGLPGERAQHLGVLGILTVALSVGFLVLLAVDQPGRAAGLRSGSSYAS